MSITILSVSIDQTNIKNSFHVLIINLYILVGMINQCSLARSRNYIIQLMLYCEKVIKLFWNLLSQTYDLLTNKWPLSVRGSIHHQCFQAAFAIKLVQTSPLMWNSPMSWISLLPVFMLWKNQFQNSLRKLSQWNLF